MWERALAILTITVLATGCAGGTRQSPTAPLRASPGLPRTTLGVTVVPWKYLPDRDKSLPAFPGSFRDPHVPWCDASDLRIHTSAYQMLQQASFARVHARNISSRACGVQGVPTVIAFSKDGAAISPTHVAQPSFTAERWIQLAPGAGAHFLVTISGANTSCYFTIARLAVRLGHTPTTAAVEPPSFGGPACDLPGKQRFYDPGVSASPWLRNEDSYGPGAGGHFAMDEAITGLQRTVSPDGVLHYRLAFGGRSLRAVLDPCLPVHEFVVSDRTGNLDGDRHIYLNCEAVPRHPGNQIAFNMRLPISQQARGTLTLELRWPILIDEIYDTGDGRQTLRIHVVPAAMSAARTTMAG